MRGMPASLAGRLLLVSLCWLLPALVGAGFLLVSLFEDHVVRQLDAELSDHLEELVAGAEVEQGRLRFLWLPFDPRFNRPLSGWYWQVAMGGEVVARSPSLVDGELPLPPGRASFLLAAAPGGMAVRGLRWRITFPGEERVLDFAITGPQSAIDQAVAAFLAPLIAVLGLLGVGLGAAVFFQVRVGLRPLRDLTRALTGMTRGETSRLPVGEPREVGVLVAELNALLDHNQALLQRAREQSGNLAHAMRNPLAVAANAVALLPPSSERELLERQCRALREAVEKHLAQARAAGAAHLLSARVAVAPVVVDLLFSLGKLHHGRGLRLEAEGLEGLCFRGEVEDLTEILGNLLDNGCKWARSRVRVRGARQGERIQLTVEDDGPGIPEEARREVIKRGVRLDEYTPGSGLGLAIVAGLVALYGGEMGLETSPWGGVRAWALLPAA